MKVLRTKGCASEKQFSNGNLPYRPYPSTTRLAESRRVSLAGWTIYPSTIHAAAALADDDYPG